jgi:hypothetical protein
MYQNGNIKRILRVDEVDYVGFADLRKYQDAIVGYGGKIVENYKYGICIGISLPDSIVGYLPNRFDQNIACEYKSHAYSVINEGRAIRIQEVPRVF